MSFKSGFVSIVGRPNVGKSTLLNQILKTKLAIMSDVAQTTRNTIQGIYTDDEAQIIFMDTPGIHKPQDGLGNFMNTTMKSATSAMSSSPSSDSSGGSSGGGSSGGGSGGGGGGSW